MDIDGRGVDSTSVIEPVSRLNNLMKFLVSFSNDQELDFLDVAVLVDLQSPHTP